MTFFYLYWFSKWCGDGRALIYFSTGSWQIKLWIFRWKDVNFLKKYLGYIFHQWHFDERYIPNNWGNFRSHDSHLNEIISLLLSCLNISKGAYLDIKSYTTIFLGRFIDVSYEHVWIYMLVWIKPPILISTNLWSITCLTPIVPNMLSTIL